MDKEQEILRRLEELRVEQLKALRELKKVEKAKKKQRRRTAHGYSVITDSGGIRSSSTAAEHVSTPIQGKSHGMGISSKNCSRTEPAKIRRKLVPKVRTNHFQRNEHESVSTPATNEDTSCLNNDETRIAKVEANTEGKQPHKVEQFMQGKKFGSGKVNCSDAGDKIPQPTKSLDLTPRTSLSFDKSAENFQSRNVEQKSLRRLVKSPRCARKVRNYLRFPRMDNNLKEFERPARENTVSGEPKFAETLEKAESNMDESTLEKALKARETLSVVQNLNAECTSPDFSRKSAPKDTMQPRTCDNMVESRDRKLPEQSTVSLKQDGKERLISSESSMSAGNQQFDGVSENIFSQSLFEDIPVDQSVSGNEETLGEIVMSDLVSYNCEPFKDGRRGSQGDALEITDSVQKEVCSEDNEEDDTSVKVIEKVVPIETDSTILKLPIFDQLGKTSSDATPIKTLQFDSETIFCKDNVEHRLSNVLKDDKPSEVTGPVLPLSSSVNLSKLLKEEDSEETQGGNISTSMKEDAIFQRGKTDEATFTMSSIRKIPEAELVLSETSHNQASLMDDFLLFENTDLKLGVKEHVSSLLMDDYMAVDKESEISKQETVLLKRQIEGLKPEAIPKMSTDFSQNIQFSACKQRVIDSRAHFEVESDGKQGETVSQELKHLQLIQDKIGDDFDELLLSEPLIASQASPPLPEEIPSEGACGERGVGTPFLREICLQHSSSGSNSKEVRAIKFLTHHVGETTFDLIAVCLPRLLVLWRNLEGSTWVVLHKWLLDKDEEIFDVELTSTGSCIAIITGGNFSNALGRVYCVHDKGDCKFDVYDEVSFSDLGETAHIYKNSCLLPNMESTENISIVLACAHGERIILTKWTIDVICFCLEDCKDFPEVDGNEMSSLCVVQESKCLLLACVDSDVYLWNFNSCELLRRMSFQFSLLSTPVCLGAETDMGIVFLTLQYKDEKKVDLVAINPQTSQEACLKTLSMADKRNKVLCCSKDGAYVITSFQHGQILLWNIATNKKIILHPKFGDVTCIAIHREDSVIAFGTVSGHVYVNVL